MVIIVNIHKPILEQHHIILNMNRCEQINLKAIILENFSIPLSITNDYADRKSIQTNLI